MPDGFDKVFAFETIGITLDIPDREYRCKAYNRVTGNCHQGKRIKRWENYSCIGCKNCEIMEKKEKFFSY